MLIVKFNIRLFLLEYLSKTIFISFGNNLEQSEKQVYDGNPFIGYGNRMMESKKQEAARTIGRLKNRTTDQERLQGWREICVKQHLSGGIRPQHQTQRRRLYGRRSKDGGRIVRTLTEMI